MSRGTIFFVALGCAKNRVDTERMVGLAERLGLQLVESAAKADVIVVNTCGFILSAKEESIDTVLELAEHKAERCRKLIVAGCLAQRYPEGLAAEMPEVDHFVGTGDLPGLESILGGSDLRLAVRPPQSGGDEERFPRALSAMPPSAYLKIAEGCDRQCAFCIIPRLRGPQRSRTVSSLSEEASSLARAGAKELVLVAQDTTAYGHDLADGARLPALLQSLSSVEGLRWLRLLYAYPSEVDEALIQAMAGLPRVVPYLDLPFQHVDDLVLRRMRRGYQGAQVRALLARLRQAVPGIHLRATLLCGHPGETEAAHRALVELVREAELEHLGVFPFSAEDDTHAATQPDQVPTSLAEERAEEIMEVQRAISRRKLRQLRGRELEVLVEGTSDESEYLLQGRHAGQAPEVDGVVFLADCEAKPGELIRVRVTDSADYDLVAVPAET